MATSEQLRQNPAQHQPKNTKSKKDDKAIYEAMELCKKYLEDKLKTLMRDDYYFEFKKEICFSDMIDFIKKSGLRREFDTKYNDHKIKPDGGIIWLKKHSDAEYKSPVLISEVKRQGTNDQRAREGKKKQAQGNAIERLGKNLIGIKAMFNHSNMTPFVCFGWGCDFKPDSSILARVSMMNEFYHLNKPYVQKRDGNSDNNKYSPVSMYFRENQWTAEEMLEILQEVAETSARVYMT